MDRKSIIQRYSLDNKYAIELLKVLDKIETAAQKNIYKYTNFLDPYIASICGDILRNEFGYVRFTITGGYEDAERKIITIYPDYFDDEYEDIPLSVIKIENLPKEKQFNHRDVLGSILGLGLKREKIGDIIVSDEMIQIVALEEICGFAELNLTQIGRCKVTTYVDDIQNIVPKQNDFKIITDTVKSLRLDSVSASGFNDSRSKVALDIKKEKVKVNHVPILSPSYNVSEGDLISYRGKGRIILDKVLGATRKERIRISIKKFI